MRPTSVAACGSSFSISEIARAIARGSPASRRSASGVATSAPQQLARDDQPLYLARALADRAELDVAEILFRRVVLHEAVAAVNLHALLGGANRNLARVELGDRRFGRRSRGLAIAHPRGAIRQQTRGFNLCRHVGELPADRLEMRDRLAELAPVTRIETRGFI